MKTPSRREQRPQLTPRQLGAAGLIAVLFFVVLFTAVALTAGDEGGGGTQVPDGGPGIEVDVDVRHPQPRHSAQRSHSPQPRVDRQRVQAPATPRTRTTVSSRR